ncbi:hypothetical protein TSUD_307310 [Trifolium subterraneum]|nr:hypothetical protein TSUD_307310 [Trifolium subterraneum]
METVVVHVYSAYCECYRHLWPEFGNVGGCQIREYVAIKMIRSIKEYRDVAMLKVDVFQSLAQNDVGNSHMHYPGTKQKHFYQ